MIYILEATILVGFLAALIFTIIKAVEEEDWRWLAAFAVLFIFLTAFIFKVSAEEEAKGPCTKYETKWSYNAGTKTNMPYKVCTERGEWIK